MEVVPDFHWYFLFLFRPTNLDDMFQLLQRSILFSFLPRIGKTFYCDWQELNYVNFFMQLIKYYSCRIANTSQLFFSGVGSLSRWAQVYLRLKVYTLLSSGTSVTRVTFVDVSWELKVVISSKCSPRACDLLGQLFPFHTHTDQNGCNHER